MGPEGSLPHSHKCQPPVPIHNKLDPIHIPTFHFPKIHLNIILPFTPGSTLTFTKVTVCEEITTLELAPPRFTRTRILHVTVIGRKFGCDKVQGWRSEESSNFGTVRGRLISIFQMRAKSRNQFNVKAISCKGWQVHRATGQRKAKVKLSQLKSFV
jgi:hypothetical protein